MTGPPPHPDRNRIAGILFAIADRLALLDDEPVRPRAFRRAARVMERLDGDLARQMTGGAVRRLVGAGNEIGATIFEEIERIWRTGASPLLAELGDALPDGLEELLRIPAVGPAKVRRLHQSLGVTTLEGLEAACRDGRVAAVQGFGRHGQARILDGTLRVRAWRGRILLPEADRIVAAAQPLAGAVAGVTRVEPTGAVRRRDRIVDAIDLLVETEQPQDRIEPAVRQALRNLSPLPAGIAWRMAFAPAKKFPLALLRTTGPDAHRRRVEVRAAERGVEIDTARSEEDLYGRLDLAPIPPELRGGDGDLDEIGAAIPGLVRLEHLRGTFHVHTTWSDGAAPIESMAAAAAALGLEYLGISDHSRSARIANGLDPDRLLAQIEAIDRCNDSGQAPRLLKGSEVDILDDGGLDFDDDLLARLDFVIGSVHDHFSMDRDAMTRRVLRAIDHPRLTILGHPTGRLLLARDGFDIDMQAVVRRAAERGVAIELNANPRRLDLEPELCRYAAGRGVPVAIDPDAHDPMAIADIEYGVVQARRAGLGPGDILNTVGLEELRRRGIAAG